MKPFTFLFYSLYLYPFHSAGHQQCSFDRYWRRSRGKDHSGQPHTTFLPMQYDQFKFRLLLPHQSSSWVRCWRLAVSKLKTIFPARDWCIKWWGVCILWLRDKGQQLAPVGRNSSFGKTWFHPWQGSSEKSSNRFHHHRQGRPGNRYKIPTTGGGMWREFIK